jgi:S-adenosylmethionine/arginine decarboxylase-like enzyme
MGIPSKFVTKVVTVLVADLSSNVEEEDVEEKVVDEEEDEETGKSHMVVHNYPFYRKKAIAVLLICRCVLSI